MSDISSALRESIETAREKRFNSFAAFYRGVDRLISYTIIDNKDETREAVTSAMFFIQVYDAYLDEKLTEKTTYKIQEMNDEQRDASNSMIIKMADNLEYRDIIEDKSRDQIDYRSWVRQVDRYCEGLNIPREDSNEAKSRGYSVLSEVVVEIENEVQDRLINLTDRIDQCENKKEISRIFLEESAELDKHINYIGEV